MCTQCAEDRDREIAEEQYPWDLCDELSYTLCRFGLIDKTPRSSWGQELGILMIEGKEEVEAYRKAMQAEWNNVMSGGGWMK